MKYVMIVVACVLLAGCGTSGHPVPEGAFVSCLEKGGTPKYHSSSSQTEFKCVMPKSKEKQ